MVFTAEALEAWRDLDEESMRKHLDIHFYDPSTCCALFAAFHLTCREFEREFAAGKITPKMMLEECCEIHKKTFLHFACDWGCKGPKGLAQCALRALASSADALQITIPNVGTIMHLAAEVGMPDFARAAITHLPRSFLVTPTYKKRTALAVAMAGDSAETARVFADAIDASTVRDHGIAETIEDLQHAYTFKEASAIVARARCMRAHE